MGLSSIEVKCQLQLYYFLKCNIFLEVGIPTGIHAEVYLDEPLDVFNGVIALTST